MPIEIGTRTTFKDRLLLEGVRICLIGKSIVHCRHTPFRLLPLISSLRGEYFARGKTLLRQASHKAHEQGPFRQEYTRVRVLILQIILHTSAGRYICVEETALLNALEGKRANLG